MIRSILFRSRWHLLALVLAIGGLAACSDPAQPLEKADLGRGAPLETATPFEVPQEPTAPLRFLLPSPGPEPVSWWRPPLYPVPWAVAPYDHFYFVRPLLADQINWPLANYRYGGMFFDNEVHTGIDIPASAGAPVVAAGPGTVIWVGGGLYSGLPKDTTDPYGLAVAIHHDFGYGGQSLFTVYAHLSQIDVVIGQHVQAGQTIGRVGDTGHATGPHLHFEVRLGENSYYHTRNPELWLALPQGWGVLVGRLHQYNGQLLTHFPVNVYSEDGRRYETRTYGPEAVNPDDYYQENLVIGDLPAGLYQVSLSYGGRDRRFWVEIFPGQVTYFTHRMWHEFQVIAPPTPALDFLPTTPTPLPTRRP